MHLSYMKSKTRKNNKTKKTGGNKDFQLRTTITAGRLPQFAGGWGGELKGELYTNAKGDVKIVIYASDTSKPIERILNSIGTIPENFIPLYKLALENRLFADQGIWPMINIMEDITRLIVANQKPLDVCHTMLDTCESENKTLIDRIAKISTELNE